MFFQNCYEYLDLKLPSDNFHSVIIDLFLTARMVYRFFEIGNELREKKEIKNKENKIENLKIEKNKNEKNGNVYFDDIDKDYNNIMRNAGFSEIFINENYENNKEKKMIIVEKVFDINYSEENKSENNNNENKSNLRKLDEPLEFKSYEINELINEL